MDGAASAPRLGSAAGEHARAITRIRDSVTDVIKGKSEVVDLALVCMIARGHLLIEDIPGVGKSTLARALAHAVGGSFSRVQFTSDLLPADLLGVNVWRANSERFEFRQGPIFANLVLADEVNRAPPRTQGALLEAMGERQISVDGTSHTLPSPFIVLATQNPEEHHGTYPLPESQRDRFLLRVSMGYAAADVEASLLQNGQAASATMDPATGGDTELLPNLQDAADIVVLHPDLARYAQQVVQATRDDEHLRLGVSTRGALAWVAAARARALMDGRDAVAIDDLQELAVYALAHRVLVAQSGTAEQSQVASEIVRDVVARVPVPV